MIGIYFLSNHGLEFCLNPGGHRNSLRSNWTKSCWMCWLWQLFLLIPGGSWSIMMSCCRSWIQDSLNFGMIHHFGWSQKTTIQMEVCEGTRKPWKFLFSNARTSRQFCRVWCWFGWKQPFLRADGCTLGTKDVSCSYLDAKMGMTPPTCHPAHPRTPKQVKNQTWEN